MPKQSLSLADKILIICREIFPNETGYYFEAGANDGISYSNTLKLNTELGWTGMLVEPSPTAFKQLKVNRNSDICVNFALVGDSTQKIVLGTFGSGSLLSSSHPILKYNDVARLKHRIPGMARLRKVLKMRPSVIEISVPAKAISVLIDEYDVKKIHVMTLDVEGTEEEVLQGLSDLCLPDIVIVETREFNLAAITEILLSKGYLLVLDLTPAKSSKFKGAQVDDHRDLLWVHLSRVDLVPKLICVTESF